MAQKRSPSKFRATRRAPRARKFSAATGYEYDAFGNVLREDEDALTQAIGNRFRYQSNWQALKDDTSKRYYLSAARVYDTLAGRFLQKDPIALLVKQTRYFAVKRRQERRLNVNATVSPYKYAYANPLLWLDPDGLRVYVFVDFSKKNKLKDDEDSASYHNAVINIAINKIKEMKKTCTCGKVTISLSRGKYDKAYDQNFDFKNIDAAIEALNTRRMEVVSLTNIQLGDTVAKSQEDALKVISDKMNKLDDPYFEVVRLC